MNIEWTKLGFEFLPTKSNIRFSYENGQWGEGRLHNDYKMELSVASARRASDPMASAVVSSMAKNAVRIPAAMTMRLTRESASL